MILRLSQKLNTKIKAGKTVPLDLHANPLLDWSGHPISVGRTQYIILCNTASLYTCLFRAKGIAHDGLYTQMSLNVIRESLATAGLGIVYEQAIAPISETVQFAKALNRSVTGSMNDLIVHAKDRLADGEAPCQVATYLNKVILSAIRTKKSPNGYGTPNDAFRELVDKNSTIRIADVRND